MMNMMDMLKWKIIEWLVRYNVLAVARVSARAGRRMR